MGLENFDFIDDLNPSFPLGTDDVSEGDDHLRGVKLTLQNAFPSNDGPGSFPGMDFFIRGLDVSQDATVQGKILGNAQVAIALTTIDGTSGVITGPNEGVLAVQRTAPGQYEFQLEEQAWNDVDDLQVGANCQYLLGGIGVAAIVPPETNLGPGWIRIVCQPNTEQQPLDYFDPWRLHLVVFDAGRDVPA